MVNGLNFFKKSSGLGYFLKTTPVLPENTSIAFYFCSLDALIHHQNSPDLQFFPQLQSSILPKETEQQR